MTDRREPLTLREALRWDGLVAVAPLLVSTLERNELLRWILGMALEVVNAEACTLALTSAESGELDYAVVLGEKEDTVRLFPVRSGEGILGWVALHGKPIVAADAGRHPLWQREVAQKIGFATQSIVCVPLEVKGQTIGALEVLNKRGGGPFADEDVEILTAFASVAAVCVENSRLYEWLAKRATDAETELLARNLELSREKAALDAIIATMGDGLLVFDAEGRVTEMNPAAERLLGLHRTAVLGTRADDGPLAGGPLAPGLTAASIALSQAAGQEFTVSLPEGRTATCKVTRFSDASGLESGLVLLITDVSSLAEISRLKSEFVAYVAHELKAPLACMLGFAEILLPPMDREITAEERAEFVGIIRGEADRCIRLITNLLNVSRIESGRALELALAPVNVGALARQALHTAQSLSDRHVLRLDDAGGAPQVEADPDQIGEVLTNLITNAIKYSPNGGLVQVTVRPAEEGVQVSVADEGIGMTAEQLARLFTRYERVLSDPSLTSGAGLGLYLSKGIVEAHGGRIWATSAPGKGSVFHFTLPRRPPALTSAAGTARGAQPDSALA